MGSLAKALVRNGRRSLIVMLVVVGILFEIGLLSTDAQAKPLIALLNIADPQAREVSRQAQLTPAGKAPRSAELGSDSTPILKFQENNELVGEIVPSEEAEERVLGSKAVVELLNYNRPTHRLRLDGRHERRNMSFRFVPVEEAPILTQADISLRKALIAIQNPKLYGGDILIKGNNKRQRKDKLIKFVRSALVSQVSLWPEGVIFYELDPSIDHLTEDIWRVMRQFHDKTCVRFVMRQNNEPDYLRIGSLKGCFSYIGRIGGEQILSLGDGCEYPGTIAHELLHALGFYHHQNRSDRDEFLDILWENIARGKESQFIKMAPQDNLLLNEFDYDSVMLYGPRTFGKTIDKITMKPKQDGVILLEVMEKKGPSFLDFDNVNKLYNCRRNGAKLMPLF